MNSQNINAGSYAGFYNYDSLPYNCIKYLLGKDELIWKLLKYSDPDAWNKPDLTYEQKIALIYNGEDNTINYRVFLDRGQPDVNTFENCQIRIANYSVFPENRVVGTISMVFEVYTHYKNNHLSNYKTRNDVIINRMRQVFSGANINSEGDGMGTMGKLFFDRMGSESNRQEIGGQLPYLGTWMIMSVKSA
jgi:hypothetical protein